VAKIESVRELEAYKMAFDAAMRIFHRTKTFPAEERFSLTHRSDAQGFAIGVQQFDGTQSRHLLLLISPSPLLIFSPSPNLMFSSSPRFLVPVLQAATACVSAIW